MNQQNNQESMKNIMLNHIEEKSVASTWLQRVLDTVHQERKTIDKNKDRFSKELSITEKKKRKATSSPVKCAVPNPNKKNCLLQRSIPLPQKLVPQFDSLTMVGPRQNDLLNLLDGAQNFCGMPLCSLLPSHPATSSMDSNLNEFVSSGTNNRGSDYAPQIFKSVPQENGSKPQFCENIAISPISTTLPEMKQLDENNINIPGAVPVIDLAKETSFVSKNSSEQKHQQQQEEDFSKKQLKQQGEKGMLFQTGEDGMNENNSSKEQEYPRQCTKLNTAVDLYRAEIASLIKRCMLMSGYAPTETEECDDQYLKFVAEALKVENQRVKRLHSFAPYYR